jgi:uncharacterized damage-inducible protein DinB
MNYAYVAIPEDRIPRASSPAFQHLVDIYAGETNKVASVWSLFTNDDLEWRPHARSTTVGGIMQHQLLSERRFFAEFIGTPELPAAAVLPSEPSVAVFTNRLVELAAARLEWIAAATGETWSQRVRFFDTERERVWVFWRRVLHTAHHRTQLTVYLRLLDRIVPATYGPTADVTWSGADPTISVGAAGR